MEDELGLMRQGILQFGEDKVVLALIPGVAAGGLAGGEGFSCREGDITDEDGALGRQHIQEGRGEAGFGGASVRWWRA